MDTVKRRAVVLGCLVLLAACVAALAMGRRDRPTERFVDIDAGGHRLHMLIVGEAGPTVVLESGLPGGLGWQQVRGHGARFARVVAYDRAGIGKSDPGPLPRNARQIATELHTALHNANLPPPYVLVGQSMGGPYVRVFAAMYPQEVCGMVLVDPLHAEVIEPLHDVQAWFASHCPDEWGRVEAILKKAPKGSESLLASSFKICEECVADFPESRRQALLREWWALVESAPHETFSPALSPGARDEFKAALETCRQTVAAQPLPKVPVILLAAGQPDVYSEVTASLNPNMRELHQAMKRWQTEDYRKWVDGIPGAKLVIAKRSGHNIQSEDPRLVIDAIREVVERAVRNQATNQWE